MKNEKENSGFTLVEIMLATVISVMVFVAMGALLTRSFTLWMDAMANWKLAQHARVSRTRLLDGGFGPGTGLLASYAANAAVVTGAEAYIQYYPLAAGGAFRAYGWASSADGKDLRLRSAASAWLLGQNVAGTNYAMNVQANVHVELFKPKPVTNKMLEVTYQLRTSLMGKTNTQPCTVRAFLSNQL